MTRDDSVVTVSPNASIGWAFVEHFPPVVSGFARDPKGGLRGEASRGRSRSLLLAPRVQGQRFCMFPSALPTITEKCWDPYFRIQTFFRPPN